MRDRLEEERAATQRAIDESESRVRELTANINAMRGLLESQNSALAGMEQRANADSAADAAASATPGAAAPGADAAAVDPAAADPAAASGDPAAASADPAAASADPAADPAASDAPAGDTPAAAEASPDPAAAATPLGEDTPTPTWANEKVIALFGGLLAVLAVGLAVITLRRRARPSTRFDLTDSAREPNMAGLPVLPADSALPASSPAAAAAGAPWVDPRWARQGQAPPLPPPRRLPMWHRPATTMSMVRWKTTVRHRRTWHRSRPSISGSIWTWTSRSTAACPPSRWPFCP
ncbi:hypothetical protein [Pigmentiphaga litoralis]|uniref:hypothetical protein n=1 Tax=Pigmentiphaga litoralis TaxID=516702 RepID=UPI003B436A66